MKNVLAAGMGSDFSTGGGGSPLPPEINVGSTPPPLGSVKLFIRSTDGKAFASDGTRWVETGSGIDQVHASKGNIAAGNFLKWAANISKLNCGDPYPHQKGIIKEVRWSASESNSGVIEVYNNSLLWAQLFTINNEAQGVVKLGTEQLIVQGDVLRIHLINNAVTFKNLTLILNVKEYL